MEHEILPCKSQIGDRVLFEIGTNEQISGWVTAIKFTDVDVAYDLAIQTGPNETVGVKDIPAANVSVIAASVEHPARHYGRMALQQLQCGEVEAAVELLKKATA